MDETRFDSLAKSFGTGSRRQGFRLLASGVISGLFAHTLLAASEAKRRKKKKKCKSCTACQQCKKGKCQPKPEGTDCGGSKVCLSGACVCPTACCSNDDCDTGNPCVTAACNQGSCEQDDVPNGTVCGDPCTICQSGVCTDQCGAGETCLDNGSCGATCEIDADCPGCACNRNEGDPVCRSDSPEDCGPLGGCETSEDCGPGTVCSTACEPKACLPIC